MSAFARCAACNRDLDREEVLDIDTGEPTSFDFCSESCAEWFEADWNDQQDERARQDLMSEVVQRYGAHMIGRLI